MEPVKLRVHVDELVLHGVERRDAPAFAAALQQELGRALAERGLPAALAAHARIPSLALTAPAGDAARIGRAIAGGLQQ
ncbi:MAG: hypothetical protein EYC70_09060 [Planctomycetota bacterium]|nr:MAG: hypothetical protein EYC70_09060 [Planctomycetota bacterium]